MRKYYIDNLKWILILVLVPYHVGMSFNTWGEPNYIMLDSDKLISSFLVFFSPWFMPLLFLLAGTNTSYSIQKRGTTTYLKDRTKRLLLPFVIGVLILMPVQCYMADVFNYRYSGNLFSHYGRFFRITDLSGSDGCFSVGHYWFLIYLYIISIIGLLLIKIIGNPPMKIAYVNSFILFALWIPLPFISDILSIGGKSLLEYTYLFLVGYYIFSNDATLDLLENKRKLTLMIGLISSGTNIYLFLWADYPHHLLNVTANYIAEWFMILALIGYWKKYFDFSNAFTHFMTKNSFGFYFIHYVCVVGAEFFVCKCVHNHLAIFLLTSLLSYILVFSIIALVQNHPHFK